MRRITLALLAASYTILAGCSESPVSPPPQASLIPSGSALFSRGGGGDGASQDFEITPRGGSVNLFGNLAIITFGENAICDQGATGYSYTGTGSCTPVRGAVKIHVTLHTQTDGSVAYNFSPELRFNPNTVTFGTYAFASLVMRRYSGTAGFLIGIPFLPALGLTPVSDGVIHIDRYSGLVWRYIGHFSGYSVTSGGPCDPSSGDPDCIDLGDQ